MIHKLYAKCKFTTLMILIECDDDLLTLFIIKFVTSNNYDMPSISYLLFTLNKAFNIHKINTRTIFYEEIYCLNK